MTPHTAKGLEFDHVFIIRASSPSFPASFKESLVEFPRELRDPDSLAHEDDKVLHGQEERRLFYVAMTRARDSLTLYAKRGTGGTVADALQGCVPVSPGLHSASSRHSHEDSVVWRSLRTSETTLSAIEALPELCDNNRVRRSCHAERNQARLSQPCSWESRHQ
jgi:ATP-dependent exoDNAse (exonuclease V) beta subunit